MFLENCVVSGNSEEKVGREELKFKTNRDRNEYRITEIF